MPVYGPINQPGTFQGVPIKIGGENDPVPIHLEDGKNKYIVQAKRGLAKEIADYLFTTVVRIEGVGRWVRTSEGAWDMLSFTAHSVRPLENADLRTNVTALRDIESAWKNLADPRRNWRNFAAGERFNEWLESITTFFP